MGMKKQPKIGDYVLATKWRDGSSKDHFCVGFLDKILKYSSGDRFIVVDKHGQPFRANGFRRVEKVSTKRGNWIVLHLKEIEESSKSVWWWARRKLTVY